MPPPQKSWMQHWKFKPTPRVPPPTVHGSTGTGDAITATATANRRPLATPVATGRSSAPIGVPPQSRPLDIPGTRQQQRGRPISEGAPAPPQITISPGSGAPRTQPPLQRYVHHWKVDSRSASATSSGPGILPAHQHRPTHTTTSTATTTTNIPLPPPPSPAVVGVHFHQYLPPQPPGGGVAEISGVPAVTPQPPPVQGPRAPSPARVAQHHPYREPALRRKKQPATLVGGSGGGGVGVGYLATSPPTASPLVPAPGAMSRSLSPHRTHIHPPAYHPPSVGHTPPTYTSYLTGTTPPSTTLTQTTAVPPDPMHAFNMLLVSVERQLKLEEEEEERARKSALLTSSGILEETATSSGSDTEPMCDVDAPPVPSPHAKRTQK